MQIEIKIDASCPEPKIIVVTASMSEEINEIIQKLSTDSPPVLSGIREDKLEILEPSELIRVYANAGKVLADTPKGIYTVRLRLYQLEELLNPNQFVRISHSEIINLKKVENFDLNFAGTICVTLDNGTTTYVSRRYVSKIKKILGI